MKMIFYQTYSGQNQGRKNIFDFRTLRFRAPQNSSLKGKKTRLRLNAHAVGILNFKHFKTKFRI